MFIGTVFLIGVGLAMDAFAVSIGKGLSMKQLDWRKALIIALYFGFFQALMPVIGYYVGSTFEGFVTQIDHWIAFFLLLLIGLNMIKEAFDDDGEGSNDSVDVKTMLLLAVATSIDALAIGITFAFLRVDLLSSVLIIGIVTFLISLLGVKIGNRFGSKYESKAEILGGLILIAIGFRILLEHLGIV